MSALLFFFFKQKTAYEMRISDWSSDVCSSDLHHRLDRHPPRGQVPAGQRQVDRQRRRDGGTGKLAGRQLLRQIYQQALVDLRQYAGVERAGLHCLQRLCRHWGRSEEHTSELQSLMRISYAVFCLKKQKTKKL